LAFLKRVSVVACEDTRTLKRFLSHHSIPCPELIPYHDHNGMNARPKVMESLRKGVTVGLVSDRGMPLVSDAGYKLVLACLEEGIPVTTLPGPSAVTTALCVSGLPPDRFFFQGFLPRKTGQQQTVLQELKPLRATLIFFEAPHRLVETLETLKATLGDRQAAVARELTKRFESVKRFPLSGLITHYLETPAKGELVIVVEGAVTGGDLTQEQTQTLLKQALADGYTLKDAVERVAGASPTLSKRDLYTMGLRLKA